MAVKVGKKGSKGAKAKPAAVSKRRGEELWEVAPTEMTRQCVFMRPYGDTGTGKTTFALTAPEPIFYMFAAEKTEGVIQPVARKKEVYWHNFGGRFKGGREAISDQANQVMAEFKAALDHAYTKARTIIIDTDTEAWELLRLARFGTATPRGHIPSMYGPLNAEWQNMIKKTHRDQEAVNLICIGQIREQYRNDKPTGIMEPAGQKSMSTDADVVVRMDKKKGIFTATIEKGWMNASAEDIPLENEAATFPMVMSLITEQDPGEWGG